MAKKGNQVITQVYLPEEVYAALRDLSLSTGAPMAHYIRKGIERELAEHNALPPPRKPRAKK